jgi:cell division protein FtsB
MSGAQPRRPPPPDRPRFTSRAAVLAVVVCAIALSLAYPVREYIAQRRQLDQLQAQSAATTAELARLRAEALRLNQPAYIEQQARDRLHMCLPGASCYVIIGGRPAGRSSALAAAAGTPWYERVWNSVRQADQGSAGQGSAGQGSAGQGSAGQSASHAR